MILAELKTKDAKAIVASIKRQLDLKQRADVEDFKWEQSLKNALLKKMGVAIKKVRKPIGPTYEMKRKLKRSYLTPSLKKKLKHYDEIQKQCIKNPWSRDLRDKARVEWKKVFGKREEPSPEFKQKYKEYYEFRSLFNLICLT